MTMKSDVIANIRTLQGYREQKVAAESTLARLKTEDLTALLAELSGDEYTVNEHGMVVASNGHDTDAADEGEITEEDVASEGVDPVEGDLLTQEADDAAAIEGETTDEKPVDTAPVAAELLDVQPAKAKTGDRRSKYSDEAVINVSASKLYGNGKSASYQRRALLRNGMTVAQYIAAVVELQGNDANARRQLDGAIRHGLATVSEPITC